MNDPKIIAYIKSHFVPVSGAVEMLQPSRYGGKESAASEWFEHRAKEVIQKEQKKFWEEFHTLQGFYVMSPDGKITMFKVGLAYDTDMFLDFLKQAKAKFNPSTLPALNIRPREIADGGPQQADKGTSVIRVLERILPLDNNSTLSERSIGRDHMWIFSKEVQEMVVTANKPNVDVPMPPAVVSRLVRFHLLNNVGNIMHAYGDDEVKLADFKMHLDKAAVESRQYTFSGIYKSSSDASSEHGASFMNGTIYGAFDIDVATNKITKFRAYGEATTQGRNDSLAKERTYPIVFCMKEANDKVAKTTPPFWYAVSPIFQHPYMTAVLPK